MAAFEKRVTSKGEIRYRCYVRLKGAPSKSKMFDTLKEAKEWAKVKEKSIKATRRFPGQSMGYHTVNELIDRYIERELPNKCLASQKYNYPHYFRFWRKHLGKFLLEDITHFHLIEIRDSLINAKSGGRKGKYTNSTINKYIIALSHCFTVAVKQWGWMNDNPALKVQKLKESRGRVRFLSDKERIDLLATSKISQNPYLYTIVVLALSTGARRSEIMNLKWSDVDFERQRINLEHTKNGERRTLHLKGHAFDLLYNQYITSIIPYKLDKNMKKPVFVGSTGKCITDFKKGWLTALKRASIEDFRFHDLRHSAASYLAMNGATLIDIAEILGHKTLQMVQRYAHLSETHASSVVEKMNFVTFKNINKEEEKPEQYN